MGTPLFCISSQLRCQVGNITFHEWYYDPSSWTDPFQASLVISFSFLFGQLAPAGLTMHRYFSVGHMHQYENTPQAPFWLQDLDCRRLRNHAGATCIHTGK